MARPFLLALLVLALAAPSLRAQSDSDRLEQLFWQRQEQELERYTADDVAFMTGMIGHHAQALVMTAFAVPNGANSEVVTLAARITNAQRDEIASMQRWLRERGEPVPTYAIEGTLLTMGWESASGTGPEGMDHAGMDHGSMDHGEDAPDPMDHAGMDHGDMDHGSMDHGGSAPMMHDHTSMPGMLSQAQLDELAAAQGAAFDRLFLRYMIQHHGGAVVMVEDLFAADGAAQGTVAFRFASDVQVDQRTEIARMQRMLDALPTTD